MKVNDPVLLILLTITFTSVLLTGTEAATEYNRYLAHLFRKYGDGGTLSFEGLEHLMYNLGLGQIEFDPEHTIEKHRPEGFDKDIAVYNDHELKAYFEQQLINLQVNADTLQRINENHDKSPMDTYSRKKGIILEFKEMHDPNHRHPRENDGNNGSPPVSSNVCLSPKSLLRLVVDHDDLHNRKLYKTITSQGQEDHNSEEEYNEFINNVKLTPVAFMKLCPALLAQIDQHVCVRPAPLRHAEDPKTMLWNAWIYASASIFILSACGLFGILLVPLMRTAAYQEILKFLVAIAVGTLSGDALMHLLPHALFKDHGDEGGKQTHLTNTKEGHSHDNTAVLICGCAFATAIFMYILENMLPLLKGEAPDAHGHSHNGHGHSHGSPSQTKNAVSSTEHTTMDTKPAKEINTMLNETKEDMKTPSRPLTPLAFMVVIGDGLHNLTDGLAIGAAFASDPVTGMATAFAVLCHELPHELGDFALLLQTGVSLRRAVYLNIVSSVLSFLGMAIGLLIAGVHSNMTQWIYAGTAGSFLYIAFADLLPAMATEGKPTFKNMLLQSLGIIVGGLIMLLIAMKEDDLEKIFQ